MHVKRSKTGTNHFIDMFLLEGKDIPNAVKSFESIEKGFGQPFMNFQGVKQNVAAEIFLLRT